MLALDFPLELLPVPQVIDAARIRHVKIADVAVGSSHTDYERLKHIRIMERNDYRNNIIERIQGTLRERVKVMRGFHNPKSAELILNLFVIWYNFLRVHQGIGMTPAEKAGINLNLDKDKWLNLIYKSKIN